MRELGADAVDEAVGELGDMLLVLLERKIEDAKEERRSRISGIGEESRRCKGK